MKLSIGIDAGSTTLKIVVLDAQGNILYKSYERHMSKVRSMAYERINALKHILTGNEISIAITGSAGMGISKSTGLDFIQEVFATSSAVKQYYPQTDVVVELGGEDAKIIFLTGATEERMNSTCAGGTGAFIDQMATLLNVTIDELDALSLEATDIYPIASRCGVFAKTDVQPLINQGAKKENIAASIYQAVVDQTIAGLAQGREVKGNVLFLGGPLSFQRGLQKAFVDTLKLDEQSALFTDNARYFVAIGAAEYAKLQGKSYSFADLSKLLYQASVTKEEFHALPALFEDDKDYEAFVQRHKSSSVARAALEGYSGKAYLGIDAGSTTTKMVLINENNEILFDYYSSNQGNPIDIVKEELAMIYAAAPEIQIFSSAATGYGEDLMKEAFGIDHGVVETVAHYMAAKYFDPKVDFLIDIGGQDMKCFKIIDENIDSLMLNEACSSGCGSFIETFATSLGYSVSEFAQLALKSKKPVDLGSRCTVFMNSSVKQAQKNGALPEDIAAGLAISVVKNSIYKVIRATDPESLGQHIVVQGGTFLNDGVLRAFEMQVGRTVVRPEISGLMGAFGAALFCKALSEEAHASSIIKPSELAGFYHNSKTVNCNLCTNHCLLTVNTFSNGQKLLSGNKCSRPLEKKTKNKLPNLYEFKQDYLYQFKSHKGTRDITIGIPLVLNFYDTLPFWFTFFKELGFSVEVSDKSTRELYKKGQHTIPSDTVCYGAKLVHGHIFNLVEKDPNVIFYPATSYNINEGISDNNYNCPVVAYYPEVVRSNIQFDKSTGFMFPYVSIHEEDVFIDRVASYIQHLDSTITLKDMKNADQKARTAYADFHKAVLEAGKNALAFSEENNIKALVLSGRPYHIDPEINHGIDRLASSLGFVVLSEDAVPMVHEGIIHNVLNQWSYHARMYNAARFIGDKKNIELVQLISFGCGLDAVTSDELREILHRRDKLYTQIKIDEINNLGAVKIRLRSLIAVMDERSKKHGR